MKSNNLKYAIAAILLAGFYTVKADDALNASQTAEIKSALTSVSLTEAVKNSVSLVAGANPSDRSAVTVEVLQTVAHTHASALSKVVAAIVRQSPDMAVDAASEAARLHPEEVVSITRGAVQASPTQAGAIVESVLFFAPERYQEVGAAAIDAAPSQTREILHAVSINSLGVRAYIENALAGNSVTGAAAAKEVLRKAGTSAQSRAKYHPLDMTGAQVAQNTSLYGGTSQYGLHPLNVSGVNSVVPMTPSGYSPPPIITGGGGTTGLVPAGAVNGSTSDTGAETTGGRTYSSP